MRSAAVAALVLLLAACAATPATPPPVPSSPPQARESAVVTIRKVQPLPADSRFDYQIGGAYDPVAEVAVVGRDRREPPVPGRYNVCYVNAFQTQPEDAAWWTGRHPDLLLRGADGQPVADPGWPGEMLLDISTEARREAVMDVVGPWVDGCAADGYQALEPDLDSWTRSDGLLTRADAVAFATRVALQAHGNGLVVAQKNAAELGRAGRDDARLDFAVAEECQVHDECDAYTDVYGDRVLEVEYTDNPRSAYEAACRARGARISVVLRDRDVVPRGRPGYTYEAC